MKKTKAIECRATRHADTWVASIPHHGVYGHGRTLRALHSNLLQGLQLVGVTTEITLVPVSPELERLRRAEAAYEAALSDAVTALAAHGGTPRDIADATGVTTTRVAALRIKRKARRPRKQNAAPGDGGLPHQRHGEGADGRALPASREDHECVEMCAAEPGTPSPAPRAGVPLGDRKP